MSIERQKLVDLLAAKANRDFPRPLTNAEIITLAQDMIAQNIIPHYIVPQSLIPFVFFPAFDLVHSLPISMLSNIIIYGHTKNSSRRALNGYPMFVEVNVIRVSDWDKALTKYQFIQSLNQAILNEVGKIDE
jgi:hypothetical protein